MVREDYGPHVAQSIERELVLNLPDLDRENHPVRQVLPDIRPNGALRRSRAMDCAQPSGRLICGQFSRDARACVRIISARRSKVSSDNRQKSSLKICATE